MRRNRWALVSAAVMLSQARVTGESRFVHDEMERVNSLHRSVERDLKKERWEGLSERLAELKGAFERLAASYDPRYGGDARQWSGFCLGVAAAYEESHSAARRGDRAAAESALHRAASIREEAHRRFKPSLWDRLRGRPRTPAHASPAPQT
jgi:hypothetical protein